MANVVERKRGEYAAYLATSSVASSEIILVTLYECPWLSKDVREEIGMYLAYQTLV